MNAKSGGNKEIQIPIEEWQEKRPVKRRTGGMPEVIQPDRQRRQQHRPEGQRVPEGQRRPERQRVPDRREVQRRRKRRRRKAMAARTAVLIVISVFLFSLLFIVVKMMIGIFGEGEITDASQSQRKGIIKANDTEKPLLTEDFLTVNPYSRPGTEIKSVKNIFIHYTANPGTTAAQNRSYFENLGITGETSASAHFVIGYEGEIIQCIPLEEIGYAVKGRNEDSISIECCYLEADGKFTEATYQSLIQLTSWLMKQYKLAPEDILRHYDEGGKKCPLYFVENEQSWEQFRTDLTEFIMN